MRRVAVGRYNVSRNRSALVWVPLSILVLAILIIPIFLIIPMGFTSSGLLSFPPPGFSFRWFRDVFSDPAWMGALGLSVKVAVLAMIIGCSAGAAAAIGLLRARGPMVAVAVAVLMLPIIVPLIALAYADYALFSQLGLLGHWISIALAHGILGAPYAFIMVRASLNGLDPSLERAARSLGAKGFTTFRHVYWPAMSRGVIGAAILIFALSFDEVVIAYFLQSPGLTTVPVKMFTDIKFELSPDIAAMATVVMLIAALVAALGIAFGAVRGVTLKATPATQPTLDVDDI